MSVSATWWPSSGPLHSADLPRSRDPGGLEVGSVTSGLDPRSSRSSRRAAPEGRGMAAGTHPMLLSLLSRVPLVHPFLSLSRGTTASPLTGSFIAIPLSRARVSAQLIRFRRRADEPHAPNVHQRHFSSNPELDGFGSHVCCAVTSELRRTRRFRVIAATNRDLRKAVERGEFREDCITACRSSRFGCRRCGTGGATCCPCGGVPAGHRPIGRAATRRSDPGGQGGLAGPWLAGNVRELRNALERASILCEGGLITAQHLRWTQRIQPPDDHDRPECRRAPHHRAGHARGAGEQGEAQRPGHHPPSIVHPTPQARSGRPGIVAILPASP